MQELKDVSIHHTALKILSEITSSKNYDETIYKTVQVYHCQNSVMWKFQCVILSFVYLLWLFRWQKLVCSPDVDKCDMKRTLEQAIKANGLETEIRNMVFHLLRASNKTDTKNPVQCVRHIHVENEKNVYFTI